MESTGRTLKIYVMGSDSKALKSVEIANWTGVAFIGNRAHLQHVRSRPELSEPGVYLLLSESNENSSGLTDIYIGETDDFTNRLSNHVRSKDWWDTFVVFVSKDQNLTKAHVKFLERELHLLARKSISTLFVRNDVEPGGSKLPESDISSMREFLSNMRFLLETLGLSYFPSQESKEPARLIQSGPINSEFYTELDKVGDEKDSNRLRSFMSVRDSIFILKAGSYIRKDARESFGKNDSYFSLWKQITESELVEEHTGSRLFKTLNDIEFRSPSAAAAVVKGRNANGRTSWRRVSDDKTYAECEADLLNDAA